MSEEKLKVLDMLKDGKITTEEALSLLNQLNDSGEQRFKSQNRPASDQDFSWIYDIKDSVLDSVRNMQSNIASQPYFPFGFGWSNYLTYSACSKQITQGIESLRLIGKNDKIEIIGHDEDTIKVDARYKAKAYANPMISFEEEDGYYTLSYDSNAVQFMGLSVRVPKAQITGLYVENKNADITLKNINFEKADILTKNAPIRLEDIVGKDLAAETKNASIKLQDGTVSSVELLTTNAKIVLQNTNADFAKLQTSNASIHMDGIDIRKIVAKTSNAALKFKELKSMMRTQYPLYTIEAYTTNGEIIMEIPESTKIPCKIKASTTMGNVYADFDDLEFVVKEKSYMDAKTKDYDDSLKKISFVLQTTNGHIRFRSC